MAADLELYRKMFDLRKTTVLVAGGAGGIGSAISAGLAALGCYVFLTARTEEKAEEVARTIREGGGEAVGISLNVERLDDLKRFSIDLHKRVPK
ncbi:MAG TPA: SDR family NAD(P)-dependent oxidoreductase, partial [Rectinema sp.]|nr:SDR family NAD(P)-dependent oxidoreductase [Rectinema sp.]